MYKPWYSEADEQAMQRRPEAYVAVLWGARELLRTGKRKRVGAALADAGMALFGPVVKWWRPLCEEAVANLLDARALPGALAAQYAARPRVQVLAKYDEHPDPQRSAVLLDEAGRYLVDDYEHRHLVGIGPQWGFAPGAGTIVRSIPEQPRALSESTRDGRHHQDAELPALSWPRFAPLHELAPLSLRERDPQIEVVIPREDGTIEKGSGALVGIDPAAPGGDMGAFTIGYRAGAPRGDGTYDAVEVLEISMVENPPDPHAMIIRELAEKASAAVAKLPEHALPAVANAITDELSDVRRFWRAGYRFGVGEAVIPRRLAIPLPIRRDVEDTAERHVHPSGVISYEESPTARAAPPEQARCPQCQHLLRFDIRLGFESEDKPDAALVNGLRSINFRSPRRPRGDLWCTSCNWRADLFEPDHACPDPQVRTSLALVEWVLGMVDAPPELLAEFRKRFHVPDSFAYQLGEHGWAQDEHEALLFLREECWREVLTGRRAQLVAAITKSRVDAEERNRGGVLTGLDDGLTITFAKGANAPDVDGMPFKQWRQETEGRLAWVALPREHVVPAWALEAVLRAAPRDAFVQGVHHDWTCDQLRVGFRSFMFPKVEAGEIPRGVAATWDHEARTVKVDWPVREDLENPKP